MPHDMSLIATIAIGLAFAGLGGYIALRLRLSPIIGYLAAGVAVGPFTPGFVADPHLAPQLAELGVILIMFGVGRHFSIGDLVAVRRIAIPGALAQITAATLLGMLLAAAWGWSWGTGIVFGLALSVASTVVMLRAFEAQGRLETEDGRIALGWLLVEDLVIVLALVALPALAGVLGADGGAAAPDIDPGALALRIAGTLGQVALFVAFMLLFGTRLFPWLLRSVRRTGSREIFTLAVLALALGTAFGSARLFGVSLALGAFFAGVVVGRSDVSHRAAAELRPLQDAFSALFFVAVGMLFDPAVLLDRPFRVVGVVATIMVGKSLAAFAIVLLLGYRLRTALSVSAALGQVGEFSFILAGLGLSLGLLPPESQGLIVAGAILSIALNPLLFRLAARLAPSPPVAAAGLALLLVSTAGVSVIAAHPAVGVVEDARGTIFYTDTERVWRVTADGRATVAVSDVHTHELMVDAEGNLIGEHLWYEGDATARWGHRVWRRSPDGRVTDLHPARAGFLSDDGFARDAAGNHYFADRGATTILRRRSPEGRLSIVAELPSQSVGRLMALPDGTLHVLDGGDLRRVSPAGVVTTVARQLSARTPPPAGVTGLNYHMGLWSGPDGSICVAVAEEALVLAVSPGGAARVLVRSPPPWRPSGGLHDRAGRLWLLEYDPRNTMRLVRVTADGDRRVVTTG